MVQMVFVHGVGTRSSANYDVEKNNRTKLFEQVLFEGLPARIQNPIWGDLAPATPVKALARRDGVAAFGGALGGLNAGVGRMGGDGVAAAARENPVGVLDSIFVAALDRVDRKGDQLDDDMIRAFKAAGAALADPAARPDFSAASTDAGLVHQLQTDQATRSYGLGGWIRDAVGALADRARNTVSTGIYDAVREDVNPAVARFLGDVFIFLKDGEVRRRIHACVGASIATAHAAARGSSEPLVLMGHSLGGVILYDMLSSPQACGLPTDLSVDALVTVGSQVGFFEELGLFDFKNPGAGGTPGPACVTKTWLNVLDPIDPLGFLTAALFAMPVDFAFDSVTGLVSAHSTYFKRPQFHARTRARLKEANVI